MSGAVETGPSPGRVKLGPGVYGLVFRLGRKMTAPTGRLGRQTYRPGWYAYIGSAMGGISARLRHHLRGHDRPRWHIDYVLPHCRLVSVVTVETRRPLECLLAVHLAKRFQSVDRFGSSDCRCSGHLFHSERMAPLRSSLIGAAVELGAAPTVVAAHSLDALGYVSRRTPGATYP